LEVAHHGRNLVDDNARMVTVMNRTERQQLLDDNAARKAEILADMQRRAEHRALHGDPSEWSPRANEPQALDEAAIVKRVRTEMQTELRYIVESIADQVGELTGKMEKSLRDEIATLQNQIDDLRMRLENIEADQNRSWFRKRKA